MLNARGPLDKRFLTLTQQSDRHTVVVRLRVAISKLRCCSVTQKRCCKQTEPPPRRTIVESGVGCLRRSSIPRISTSSPRGCANKELSTKPQPHLWRVAVPSRTNILANPFDIDVPYRHSIETIVPVHCALLCNFCRFCFLSASDSSAVSVWVSLKSRRKEGKSERRGGEKQTILPSKIRLLCALIVCAQERFPCCSYPFWYPQQPETAGNLAVALPLNQRKIVSNCDDRYHYH